MSHEHNQATKGCGGKGILAGRPFVNRSVNIYPNIMVLEAALGRRRSLWTYHWRHTAGCETPGPGEKRSRHVMLEKYVRANTRSQRLWGSDTVTLI
ncbi:hypothetical protein AGOR_G00194140 [Albula goreensis]|uniref:Uncharacterized protein n=1 Tax=Albula goreensis TaxID=1534307 RepID=A0A8T3CYV8_9TELE|nr:hypothetical protein AGOR_G00194140 [Albula goreensis]